MLTWKEEYSVGVEFLDNQHRQLFELGNRSLEIMKRPDEANIISSIQAVFQELKNYTNYHFKSEEEYMLQIHFEEYLDHKKKHDEFIEKLDKIQLSENISAFHFQEIFKTIINWILYHVLSDDRHYKNN